MGGIDFGSLGRRVSQHFADMFECFPGIPQSHCASVMARIEAFTSYPVCMEETLILHQKLGAFLRVQRN
jgi:hypothetical protein